MARPLLVNRTPFFPALWVAANAWIVCAGWLLSLAHQLNAAGYAVVFFAGAAAVAFAWKKNAAQKTSAEIFHRLWRRFRRPLPFAFFTLAALAFLGGAIYAPNNYDGLAYRTPRVLHWLAEGRWHWIHTDFARLNTRACNYEWLSAPLLALTKTDRFFFLIDWICFALLPGRIFAALRGLGAKSRVAWRWMWILPGGYCFVLQAGSIGNDLPGATFALIALEFALRARMSQRVADFFTSVLAASIMSGIKASNLPLLLPWATLVFPSLCLHRKKIASLAWVACIAVVCSFLPMAAINQIESGDWTGAKGEGLSFSAPEPALRLGGNFLLLAIHNFFPPFFPNAAWWNQYALPRLVSEKQRAALESNFMSGIGAFKISEMENEEGAGLGVGVCALLAIAALGFFTAKAGGRPRTRNFSQSAFFFALAQGAASLVFLMKSFVGSGARLFAPYYVPLAAIALRAQKNTEIFQRKSWQSAEGVVFFLAALLLVLNPSRPLFPAETVFNALEKTAKSNRFVQRARTVYAVYGARADGFAPLRASLPPDARTLGLITFDDPETSLWRPFGSRKIEHVLRGDTGADMRHRGIGYVVIKTKIFESHIGEPLDAWLVEVHGEIYKKLMLTLRAGEGPAEWAIVKLL